MVRERKCVDSAVELYQCVDWQLVETEGSVDDAKVCRETVVGNGDVMGLTGYRGIASNF